MTEETTPIEIIINDKSKEALVNLLRQKEAITNQFDSTLFLILDAKDVDYEGKQINYNLELNKITIS